MHNLILRTVTGVLFVVVMVASIIYSPVTFSAVFTIIAALTTWEFATIVNRRDDVHINRLICALASAYLFVATWCCGLIFEPMLFVPYLMMLVYLFVSELYRRSEHTLNNLAFTMFSQMYVALPFAMLNYLEFANYNLPGIYVLALFVILWCSDTGAYCTGSLIGKHKLFPSISPAKTWEGSVGGGVLSVAVSVIICYAVCGGCLKGQPFFADTPTPQQFAFWVSFALVVVVFGTWGDLVESLIKRRLGIKDSGHALPGHGGWLDRFDSTLLATPAVVVFLLCFHHLL